jgi:SAM-dependent methyltransferase
MLAKYLKDYVPINLREMRPPGFDKKREAEIGRCVANVRNGQGTRKIEACPFCGSADNAVLFSRFEMNILQCRTCGLGYSEEFPVDTNDVYSDRDYLPIAISDYQDNADYRKRRFGAERLSIIAEHLGREPKGARLLDVGCGTGWFLECAKEAGFDVSGLELGRELAEFTSDRLGIEVWNKPLSEMPIGDPFDVITLFDVLEHVPDPKETLARIYGLLKPGGIALFFVPNLESLGFKILRGNSSLCMPVEHLFYFTESALRPVLEQAGFQTVYFSTRGMDIPDLYSYNRDVLERPDVALFLEEIVGALQPIIDGAGCGNHMRFVVRRPN